MQFDIFFCFRNIVQRIVNATEATVTNIMELVTSVRALNKNADVITFVVKALNAFLEVVEKW